MCFTPAVSLSTAILEFVIATFVLFKYKKSAFGKEIIILIYLLGLYQFTEFMLCTTSNLIWAKMGFITYTFLPALGLGFCLHYLKKKRQDWIYLIPIFYAIYALAHQNFILSSTCGTYFIMVQNLMGNGLLGWLYKSYYFGFIMVITLLFTNSYKNLRDKKKPIYHILFIGLVLSLGSALVLLVIFPSLYWVWPSMYCEFSVLFAVCMMIAYHLENKR